MRGGEEVGAERFLDFEDVEVGVELKDNNNSQ